MSLADTNFTLKSPQLFLLVVVDTRSLYPSNLLRCLMHCEQPTKKERPSHICCCWKTSSKYILLLLNIIVHTPNCKQCSRTNGVWWPIAKASFKARHAKLCSAVPSKSRRTKFRRKHFNTWNSKRD